MNLLKQLPGVFPKQLADGTLKEDAAQTLSNLSQFEQGGTGPGGFRVSDPGPSSYPHEPPRLGHLVQGGVVVPQVNILGAGGIPNPLPPPTPAGVEEDPPARKATGDPAAEDNHKEVERRRRRNINEGINELGRIVPSSSGEKAKGAILSHAVQYIHHLKENEARNIEKWTLEKLLMDQAMGHLRVQLDEIRRMWEEERMQRERAEQELEALREGEGGDGKRQRTE
ncbi:hypothetical protein B0H13DRAFT_2315448 [Mycena leptocephala]|nr:hypothetical protein B0H13DRAFT_2315448 [Mycena leptocephala]